jgi:hypothetical protein
MDASDLNVVDRDRRHPDAGSQTVRRRVTNVSGARKTRTKTLTTFFVTV